MQLSSVLRLAIHNVLERKLRPARAVANPVREHERGHTTVANCAAMSTCIAEAVSCLRVLHHLVRHR